jgi:uncharacterized protein (DUF433 family)
MESLADGLPIHPDLPPLRAAERGVIRVGRTRISLDLVIDEYERGAAPEGIVRAYDTLELADVYAAIAYYLRHRDEVQAYMKRREEDALALRAKIEAVHPPITREELLARRRAKERVDAPAGD